MKNKFRIALLYVSIVMLLISATYIGYSKYTKFRENELLNEVQEQKDEVIVQQKTQEAKTTKTAETVEEKNILSEYKKLYEENNDLYGWIKIEDTVIDYPVMHTPKDPNFYIHKNWKKEESVLGSIYVDGRCGEDTENLIIYGHKMRDGSMFGSLAKYKDEDYYEQHKHIEFDTLYEKATYEIIAVSKAVVYYEPNIPQNEYLFYEHVELNSKEEFDDYMRYMKDNSYYCIDSNAEYGDKIITLCTCDYWTDNARLLVVAKKI